MDKSFLKMISLSALICCFGNISVAKATSCANIKDKLECNVAHMKQSPWKVEGSPCRWIDSSSKEFNQLEKAWGQNLAGINCFREEILKTRSCPYITLNHICNHTPDCEWKENICVVSEKTTTSSSKETSSTGVSQNSSGAKKETPTSETTPPSVCSPRETPAKCADRSQEGKCFWKGNFFGKGGKCLPVGSTVKK